MQTVAEQIAELKVVPVVKLENAEDAVPLASALVKGGIPAAEITFRTACAAEAIRAVSSAFPDLLVGAGTVLNRNQAEKAAAAGAKFIVSPGYDPETVEWCLQTGMPVFPGCVTASEVQRAVAAGLTVLKFFPAEQSGGLKAIKALSAPFGQLRWMPTGGIGLGNLMEYLSFPKIIACGGSYMVNAADIRDKNWDKITEICRKTMRLVHGEKDSPVRNPDACAKEKTCDVAAMGEVLMRFSACGNGRIQDGGTFRACIGGSELNVCSGVSRLGLRAELATCLPDNDVGRYALGELRRMGVGETLVSFDSSDDARLGLYFYEDGAAPRRAKVVYDRLRSSFTRTDVSKIPQKAFSGTRLFHMSGITLALPGVREAALETARRFKEGGALVSFDVNYRAGLWDEKTALREIERILPFTDVLFVSEESSRRMFGRTGPLEEIMRGYCSGYGVKYVVTSQRKVLGGKTHGWSSVIYSACEGRFFSGKPYDTIEVKDRIGSGDAFDAGVLYGLLAKGSGKAMAVYGDAMAALKCTIAGDLPDVCKEDVERLVSAHQVGVSGEMDR